MDFLKKNYEKVILVAVLVGVVGFLLFLPIVISRDQQEMKDNRDKVIVKNPKPLPVLDMTRQDAVLQRLQSPANFDFTTKNKLFNPLEWKKDPKGQMFPIKNGNEIGLGAVVVSKITPLYLVVSLVSVTTNAAEPRYVIGLEHQAAPTLAARKMQTRFTAMDDQKKDVFTLVSVKGDPLNPDELVLKLTDTGETATLSKDKPFQRVDAYAADLKYDPEKKNFPNRRALSTISFNGEDYIIVAIGANDVILSSQSNQKKTTLRYTP
jgi:hypothetical protein